jgi:hypothetical protein
MGATKARGKSRNLDTKKSRKNPMILDIKKRRIQEIKIS